MRFSTSAVSQQRGRDASPVDYKASNPVSGPSVGTSGTSGGSSSHKRMPSLSMEEGEVLKEKKHKGSKKNKHGPGRPKGGKSKEILGAQLAGSTSTSSSPFSGGSLVSSSIGNSSRSFSHTGNLPSLSMESPLLGSGTFPLRAPGVHSSSQPCCLFHHIWLVSGPVCTESSPFSSVPGAIKIHIWVSPFHLGLRPRVSCRSASLSLELGCRSELGGISNPFCSSAGEP